MTGHSHTHDHRHAQTDFGNAFAIGVVLNSAFVLIEAAFGLLSGSMALLADAGHNLSDVLGLLIAWGAAVMAARPANARFTYGYKASSILAALANAGLLLVATGGDLALAHGPTGVVIAGGVILWTGMPWVDPVTSLLIVVVIAVGTWGLLRNSVKMALLAVPDSIHEGDVRGYLAGLPGVTAVHDLHIWPMSTTETALTAHLVMPGGHQGDTFLHEVTHELEHRFGIGHATVQIETGLHVDHCGDCA